MDLIFTIDVDYLEKDSLFTHRLVRVPEVSMRLRRLQAAIDSLKDADSGPFDVLHPWLVEGSEKSKRLYILGVILGLYERFLKDHGMPDWILFESAPRVLVDRLCGNIDDQQLVMQVIETDILGSGRWALQRLQAQQGLLKSAFKEQSELNSPQGLLQKLADEGRAAHWVDLLSKPRPQLESGRVSEYSAVIGPDSKLAWLFQPDGSDTADSVLH